MHKALICVLTALMLATGLSAALTRGGESPAGCCADTVKAKPAAAAADSAKGKKEEKKDEKKKNDYDELIKKGGTTLHGLFVTRHIDDKWYFEVPDSLLGRYLLAVTRYTSVPQGLGRFAGEEANEATVYFEKRGQGTMLLRAYVLSQVADKGDSIARTLHASTTDPIVASFKIIGEHPSGSASLIEVTQLFRNDNQVVGVPRNTSTDMKLGSMASERTFVDTMKVYPINIEIATTRTYNPGNDNKTRAGRMAGAVTLGLNTSVLLLPEQPMRKRLWDKRVGYFTSSFTRFSDKQHKAEPEQFVSRYRLVPKDVARYRRGELVEPVKPIVYYIDPATPKKWVPYLIQGINDWNVAFEAAGFKNAIIGKEWPDDPSMSVDDARYCVLRYLPAEIENAYGPCVTDPRSGEIVESHICWYHNVMNLLTKWYMTQCGPLDKRAQTMHFDDRLMGQLIRFVSSHEVGHTLGLRHNMGASHATPVERLRDKAWVEKHGHTVSIMDYARFNYVAQPEDGISERGLFPRINDYDKWAIKWGYQYRPDFRDEYAEKEGLMKETTKVLAANPQLWFAGEGRDEDPRSQTEDIGDDNVKASEYGLKNLRRVIDALPKWTHQDDGQYDDLREMYNSVWGQFCLYAGHVMKNISGNYLNNLPGRAPFEIAPAAKKREAVEYVSRNMLEPPLWLFPEAITTKTGSNPVVLIDRLHDMALSALLNIYTLNNMYTDTFRSSVAYPVTEYLDDVFGAVWKPLSGQSPLADKSRRSLEMRYLTRVGSILNPTGTEAQPDNVAKYRTDVALLLLAQLDKIDSFAQAQMAGASGIDALHYKEVLRQTRLIRQKHDGSDARQAD